MMYIPQAKQPPGNQVQALQAKTLSICSFIEETKKQEILPLPVENSHR